MTDQDVRRLEDKVDAVRLEMAEMRGELKPTFEKLAAKEDEQDTQIDDHEKRLRALERFRFSVPSLAVLGLLLDVALVIYYVTHS